MRKYIKTFEYFYNEINDYTYTDLIKITLEEAKKLFSEGICIYIKTEKGTPSSTHNLFVINNKLWDGSMNIYTEYKTPEEYGFDNIIDWIQEREKFPLEFYTLNETIPYMID